MQINKVTICCSFYGKEFSAKALQQALPSFPLEILQEKGEKATIGRYKGQISPYSHALLHPNPFSSDKAKIRDLLLILKQNKPTIDLFVIEDIEINIEISYYANRKNLFTTIVLDREGKVIEIGEDFMKTPAGQDFLINVVKNDLVLAKPIKKLFSNYEVPPYNNLILKNGTN
jgi:hypothetical protein